MCGTCARGPGCFLAAALELLGAGAHPSQQRCHELALGLPDVSGWTTLPEINFSKPVMSMSTECGRVRRPSVGVGTSEPSMIEQNTLPRPRPHRQLPPCSPRPLQKSPRTKRLEDDVEATLQEGFRRQQALRAWLLQQSPKAPRMERSKKLQSFDKPHRANAEWIGTLRCPTVPECQRRRAACMPGAGAWAVSKAHEAQPPKAAYSGRRRKGRQGMLQSAQSACPTPPLEDPYIISIEGKAWLDKKQRGIVMP
jgi:hypothetical protein